MGIGAISITSPGSVTAPTTLPITVAAALTAVFKDYGPSDAVFLPSLKAVMLCNGLDFQYHLLDGAQYLTGPLAPGAAPDVTSTAVQATVVMTFTGDAGDGSIIQIGKPGAFLAGGITFKTTLDPTGTYDQVKRGTSAANTISNLKAFINGTGVQGTEFFSYRSALLGVAGSGNGFYWDVENDIEVSASDATTITFRAKTYGTIGNTYISVETTADGNYSFASTAFTGGAAGTRALTTQSPAQGTYKHGYAFVRRGDAQQTAISPLDTTSNGGNFDMTVGSFATPPTRDGITHKRIFRSTVDGGAVLYQEEDTDGSSYADSLANATLVGPFSVKYDSSIYRPYTGGYPPRFRAATLYRGCVFGTGALIHGQLSTGTISVTKGSKSATFSSGVRYKEDIIGRTLRVTDKTVEYVIVDFVEATRVATFNRDYADATNGTAGYTLTDARDPNEVYWSATNLLNNWPVANSIKGVTSPDPAGNTAIVAAWDSLVVFTKTGLWRIFGAPDSGFRVVPQAEGCGAFSPGSVVSSHGNLYWVGPDGAFAWNGEGLPTQISDPAGEAPRGIARTLGRINLDETDQIVSDHNPSDELIRWCVPLDGAPWNTHAVVYDLTSGDWALDKIPPFTSIRSVIAPNGDYETLAGTATSELWQLDLSTSDGAFGFDPVGTYSSFALATNTTTITGTTLATSGDGLKGVPVLKVTTSGDVETGYVSMNTGDTFAVLSPWTTAPTTGDKFIFGGIEWRLKTNKCDFGAPDMPKRLSTVTASFTPQSVAGQVWLAGAKDSNDPSVFTLRSSSAADVANLSTIDGGVKKYPLRKGPGRRVQWEFVALCPGFDVEMVSWSAVVLTRDEVAV